MDRTVPENVLADLKSRGLDVGYLDRMALTPFLASGTGNLPRHIPGYTPNYKPNTDPVDAYMHSGRVPKNETSRARLRTVAEKAVTWKDPEVKTAGEVLLRLLEA